MFATALSSYLSTAAEAGFQSRMLSLLNDEPRAFFRDAFNPGHFTGSGVVCNPARTKVLLMKHKYLGQWMQFGGHADGDSDMLAVGLREACEESGFSAPDFTPAGGIFDLDIQDIPANPKRNEPAHQHFDIRRLLVLDDARPLPPNPEGLELRWFLLSEAVMAANGDPGLLRLLGKLEGR